MPNTSDILNSWNPDSKKELQCNVKQKGMIVKKVLSILQFQYFSYFFKSKTQSVRERTDKGTWSSEHFSPIKI